MEDTSEALYLILNALDEATQGPIRDKTSSKSDEPLSMMRFLRITSAINAIKSFLRI